MGNPQHLVKLSVGTETVEGLERWQASAPAQGPDGLPRHVTRMWPKREAEVLDGGSIFWVIKGLVLARQRILRLDRLEGSDGVARCAIVLEPQLHRTEAQPRRPFQGWRYLSEENAPRDLGQARAAEPQLPPALQAALAEIGVR